MRSSRGKRHADSKHPRWQRVIRQSDYLHCWGRICGPVRRRLARCGVGEPELVVIPERALLIVEERLKEQQAEGVRMPEGMPLDELALRVLIAATPGEAPGLAYAPQSLLGGGGSGARVHPMHQRGRARFGWIAHARPRLT